MIAVYFANPQDFVPVQKSAGHKLYRAVLGLTEEMIAMHKYDTHVHTGERGWCASVPANEIVRRYKKLGYSGIVITDHYHAGLFDEYRDLSFEAMTERYLLGYHNAAAEAKKLGDFDVILGMEIRFPENMNDYLIFGIDEDFLYNNPEMAFMNIEGFKRLADRNNVLIIQAHPFRWNMQPKPISIHGVEIFNGNPNHNSHDDIALAMAKDYGFFMTSGSDYHFDGGEAKGGIISEVRIKDSFEMADSIRSGNLGYIRTK